MEIQKLLTSILEIKEEVPELVSIFHKMEDGDVTCLQDVIKNYEDLFAYAYKRPSLEDRRNYKSQMENVNRLLCRCRSKRRFFW